MTLPRFIPACAGNRERGEKRSYGKPVHPRVCGEQDEVFISVENNAGSSPRVRGTEYPGGWINPRPRFIPACAGNRLGSVTLTGNGPSVHPRVCGEQGERPAMSITASGSSPRVRGTAPDRSASRRSPAVHPRVCGEQRVATPSTVRAAVHPRVCGEQLAAMCDRLAFTGSSPRVRGTERRLRDNRLHSRFIPACAGNRPWPTRWSPPRPVHPRVCGEQLLGWEGCTADSTAGSSPRVRGTAPSSGGLASSLGSSPRVRGTGPGQDEVSHDDGSSPRVRGTGNPVCLDRFIRHRPRFIPACAGNRALPQCSSCRSFRFIPACAGNRPSVN